MNEIREALDPRPKYYKAFIQSTKNENLFSSPDGNLLNKKDCLNIPARGHFFIVRPRVKEADWFFNFVDNPIKMKYLIMLVFGMKEPPSKADTIFSILGLGFIVLMLVLASGAFE